MRKGQAQKGRRKPAGGGLLCLLLAAGLFFGGLPPAAAAQDPAGPGEGSSIDEELAKDPTLLFRVALRLHQRGLYVRAAPLLALFVKKFVDHPDHQRAMYMLADAHYFIAKTGVPAEYQSAVAIYQLALQRYPDAPQMPMAYFRMGESFKVQKRSAEAQVAFRTLLERAPNSSQAPRAAFEIANRYMELNDPQSAIVEFEKIVKNYKGSAIEKEAHFGIADALFRQGLYPKALKKFDSGRKRWPGFLDLRADLLYNYAETLFQVRRFRDAAKAFLRMVNIDPSSKFTHRALARLGDLYLQEGRRKDALKVYHRVLRAYPGTEGYMVSLIRVADMGLEGKVEVPKDYIFPLEAFHNPLKAYRRVVELVPSHRLAEVALLRIASYYLKRGEIQRAIDTAVEFLKKHGNSPLKNNANLILARAYFGRIRVFYQRRQFLRAIRSYTEFREVVPAGVAQQAKPFQTMLEVGESYMRLGLYAQAVETYKQIMGQPEGVLAVGGEALFRLAQNHLRMGERERAKSYGRRFLESFSRHRRASSVRALLGEIAWKEERPREAVDFLAAALEGPMDNELRGRSLFLLAEASARIGRYDVAVESMRKAIALYPRIPGRIKPFSLEEASFRLGDLLYEGRRWLTALMAYKNALEIFPKSSLTGWAHHRIARIQDHLNLARRVGPAPAKAVAGGGGDPFWREMNRLRSESLKWDKENRAKLEEVLRQGARN